MEILAAAASVAGILSLAGQSIDGALKLKDLCSNISRASSTSARFLHDINSLLEALQSAKDLVRQLPKDFCGPQLTSLSIMLQYCTKDVYRILDIARSIRPVSDNGAKAWFQRFWVAVNKSLLVDVREELERHKQAINLSLVVIGRQLDIHLAASIEKLDVRIQRGTTASLSRIEEQNGILERIEANTETSVIRSAISDNSLHSIATSLSRIEALASSAASAAVSQKAEDGGVPKTGPRTKRRSTGDIVRARRRSGGSARSARASLASVKSLPAVPTIPENHLSRAEPARLSEVSEASTNWDSSCKETQTPWTSIHTYSKHTSVGLPNLDVTDEKIPAQIAMVDISLHQQHRLFHRLTQETMALIYPPSVLEYIFLVRAIQDYESKVSLLNLLNFGTNIEGSPAFQNQTTVCESDVCVLAQERDILQDRLWALLDNLQDCRRRCVFEGHLLHDIDERLGIKRRDPEQDSRGHVLLSYKVQKECLSLLSYWSNNRDRINRWLLDCLRSDEQQAQLHRSMLADPPINDESWTRQVLRHWYIDEAAVDQELPIPRSVGAVDSHTVDSSDVAIEDTRQGTKRSNPWSADEAAKTNPAETSHPVGAIDSPMAGMRKAVAVPLGDLTGQSFVGSGFF